MDAKICPDKFGLNVVLLGLFAYGNVLLPHKRYYVSGLPDFRLELVPFNCELAFVQTGIGIVRIKELV